VAERITSELGHTSSTWEYYTGFTINETYEQAIALMSEKVSA
jgi:hypothetical protein